MTAAPPAEKVSVPRLQPPPLKAGKEAAPLPKSAKEKAPAAEVLFVPNRYIVPPPETGGLQ